MKIAIIGRSEFLYNTALAILRLGHTIPLVVTAKESPESKITSEHFKKLSTENDALFIYSSKINSIENLNLIKSLPKIDIAVSVNYSGIIEKEVIDLFRIGILNAHGGDLPKYRGNACQAWAIINGENQIGLCVHKMIPGELDSGNIISREYLPISLNTRIGEVYSWMEETIPLLMVEAISNLEKDPNYFLEEQSKNPKDILRTYPRIPEDGKITWTNSSNDILRLINASSEPFCGSFCFFEQNKLIIWRAEIENDNESYLSIPGQVAKINNDGSVVVTTGNGKIKLIEVEMNNTRTSPFFFIKSSRTRLT